MIDIPAETTISRYAIPALNLLMRCEASFPAPTPKERSAPGQTEKNSLRANVFRVTPESGHRSMQSPCSFGVESRCDAVALGSSISIAAPFVRRCLTGSTMAPFSHPAHRTGQADFPHPALGQNFTPSPTARRAQAGSGVRAQSARKDARVDKSRPCAAWFCA